MKELVVISSAEKLPGEPGIWNKLFEAGLEKLHVRKPGFTAEMVAILLSQVEREFLSRIVIHYHSDLALKFDLAGVHYSYNKLQQLSINRSGFLSGSCSIHHWQELDEIKNKVDYCFISPVFDSISKQGYIQNEALWKLPETAKNFPVYALGGITIQNFDLVLKAGFYGFALLGFIWNTEDPLKAFKNFQFKLEELKALNI